MQIQNVLLAILSLTAMASSLTSPWYAVSHRGRLASQDFSWQPKALRIGDLLDEISSTAQVASRLVRHLKSNPYSPLLYVKAQFTRQDLSVFPWGSFHDFAILRATTRLFSHEAALKGGKTVAPGSDTEIKYLQSVLKANSLTTLPMSVALLDGSLKEVTTLKVVDIYPSIKKAGWAALHVGALNSGSFVPGPAIVLDYDYLNRSLSLGVADAGATSVSDYIDTVLTRSHSLRVSDGKLEADIADGVKNQLYLMPTQASAVTPSSSLELNQFSQSLARSLGRYRNCLNDHSRALGPLAFTSAHAAPAPGRPAYPSYLSETRLLLSYIDSYRGSLERLPIMLALHDRIVQSCEACEEGFRLLSTGGVFELDGSLCIIADPLKIVCLVPTPVIWYFYNILPYVVDSHQLSFDSFVANQDFSRCGQHSHGSVLWYPSDCCRMLGDIRPEGGMDVCPSRRVFQRDGVNLQVSQSQKGFRRNAEGGKGYEFLSSAQLLLNFNEEGSLSSREVNNTLHFDPRNLIPTSGEANPWSWTQFAMTILSFVTVTGSVGLIGVLFRKRFWQGVLCMTRRKEQAKRQRRKHRRSHPARSGSESSHSSDSGEELRTRRSRSAPRPSAPALSSIEAQPDSIYRTPVSASDRQYIYNLIVPPTNMPTNPPDSSSSAALARSLLSRK